MKQLYVVRIVAVLVAGALVLAACGVSVVPPKVRIVLGSGDTTVTGSDKTATESREVSGFSGVRLDGAGQLTIKQGDTESLSITADDNLLPYLTSEVSGQTLVLGIKSGTRISTSNKIVYQVTAKTLNAIDIEGGAEVDAQGINADSLAVTLKGGATLKVAGKVSQQSVTFDGGGNYDGQALDSETAQVTCKGAGLIVVRVSKTLDVKIDGAAVVEYIGSPQVTKSVTGLGIVRQK